ncbi:DNA mismatch repair protein Mlh1 [Savitreella phatthalungensis]
MADAEAPRRIQKLDEAVVNRIAAGEIIVRPSNALKELLENSIDAGAKSIDILVKDGGFKLLQITDNGCGIDHLDLPILCHRHTTSKLTTYNDLDSIATYGFRGEALASVTHVAQVTITTKTAASDCAYRAMYIDGELAPETQAGGPNPRPAAGRQGTVIAVENMFYNMGTRRRGLDKASDEYGRILDVVGRYAIEHAGIAFSCKRHGESSNGLNTHMRNSSLDNIRVVYGSAVAAELEKIEVEHEELSFRAHGLVSSANYNMRKLQMLLFVNRRLVESSTIRRGVENVYAAYLPKGTHPFVYLSLNINPARIDVNVSPTKREVHILNEDEIIDVLRDTIIKKIDQSDHSRTFQTKTVIQARAFDADIEAEKLHRSQPSQTVAPMQTSTIGKPPAPSHFVRTDAKQQKISSMFEARAPVARDDTDRARVSIRLTSVKDLRAAVRDALHEDLTAIISEHVFVGVACFRRRLAMMQHLTKLYLVDYGALSYELFYQLGLSEFGNFGAIMLDPPLSLQDVLERAYERPAEHQTDIRNAHKRIMDMREMLQEYFAIDITESGELKQIPLLLKGYTPPLSKLPRFLASLDTLVDWDDEKACFDTFLRQLALFYVPASYTSQAVLDALEAPPLAEPDRVERFDVVQEDPTEIELKRVVETSLFPAFKRRLICTTELAKSGYVTQLTDLPELYKVFERC